MEYSSVTYLKTPIGYARIIGDEEGISQISVHEEYNLPLDFKHPSKNEKLPFCLLDCVKQLDEYFNSERKEFDLKLNPLGTNFQLSVWKELLKIPFGKTTTYTKQTKRLGDVKAIRAVASANGRNPLWIVVPCHRVVGTDGSLTGYAGGLWRKRWLLEHESGVKQQSLF